MKEEVLGKGCGELDVPKLLAHNYPHRASPTVYAHVDEHWTCLRAAMFWGVRKRAVSKRMLLADVPLYRYFLHIPGPQKPGMRAHSPKLPFYKTALLFLSVATPAEPRGDKQKKSANFGR